MSVRRQAIRLIALVIEIRSKFHGKAYHNRLAN